MEEFRKVACFVRVLNDLISVASFFASCLFQDIDERRCSYLLSSRHSNVSKRQAPNSSSTFLLTKVTAQKVYGTGGVSLEQGLVLWQMWTSWFCPEFGRGAGGSNEIWPL